MDYAADDGLHLSAPPGVHDATLLALRNASAAAAHVPGWNARGYALRALAAQASPHACVSQHTQLRTDARLSVDLWCGAAAHAMRDAHLPRAQLAPSEWARWLGETQPRAAAAVAADGARVLVRDALHPLVSPLLELLGWQLAHTNETHAIFVLIPSFGSRPLVSLRADGLALRERATPWLRVSSEDVSGASSAARATSVFAVGRLGESARFWVHALGRTEPTLLALRLDAVVQRVSPPFALGAAARAERVRASAVARLARSLCDAVRLLRASHADRPSDADPAALAGALAALSMAAESWHACGAEAVPSLQTELQ